MNKDTNGKGFEYTGLRKEMFDIMFYRTDGRAHGDLSIEEQIDEILDRVKSYLLKNLPKKKLYPDGNKYPRAYGDVYGFNQALQSYKDFIKEEL